MGADWSTEAFKDNFAQVFEQESLADAQFCNRVRDQDLFRLRVGAEPGGQLHRRSKEIVMLLDRFPCCGTDSNLERALGIRFLVPSQFALNLDCASNRSRCRHE
jgi:hypothetical protein